MERYQEISETYLAKLSIPYNTKNYSPEVDKIIKEEMKKLREEFNQLMHTIPYEVGVQVGFKDFQSFWNDFVHDKNYFVSWADYMVGIKRIDALYVTGVVVSVEKLTQCVKFDVRYPDFERWFNIIA